ncbi:cation-transporting P-type ATPase [Macrococcoides caseolyticum]|uniref:cation-transporting P-type ATPase n=1 Tax=Macrococcoides caseolyticum TaxID=69966 RepID=UPI001F295FCE|nr:cation-transporting P-type ATPase [Macrococcus caseolyticus]MCE4956559.1 cation-transporting P-type ATPase [Macrococcus caseolyticus]
MTKKNWHQFSVDETISLLSSSPDNGLSSNQVEQNFKRFGLNTLPKQKEKPKIIKFLAHFNDVLIYVLLIAAAITGLLGHFLDMSVIILVAFINAIIGYVQESRAERALESIRNMMTSEAIVVRDGRSQTVPSEQLTIGDIVILSSGEKIPADLRLIEANNLKIEESALTGESVAVQKHTQPIEADAVLGDRKNMAYSSSSITSGSGIGIVVAIGSDTELGKINQSMAETEQMTTPLMQQTGQFGKSVSIGIVVISIAIYLFGLLYHHYPAGDLLLSVISLAVGAIPEGLPAVISIILALGVQAMAKNNAIVKNLPSVETLGSVSVICTDKTGTLTKNEMTVTSIDLLHNHYAVTGTGYEPIGEIIPKYKETPETEQELYQFLTCVKTVNEARLSQDEIGHYQITGEPTEGCLMTLVHKTNLEIPNLPAIDKIPFDSRYKYMAYLVEDQGKKRIYIKGAPDRIFDRVFTNTEERGVWEDKLSTIAKEGKRLIAAGYKDMPEDTTTISHKDLESGVTLLGLAGIIDPPRESSIKAVQACQKAGIAVKMITGDHKETAMAIGKQLGIGDGSKAIEGRQLDQMTEEELYTTAIEYDVFARTSPENKLQLVKALQQHDEITSMTGDGVNDAPALKRADIGVAMGIKGTEVSKDAARMILVDDNFETIVSAVQEGRRVYDNLKKTILFILPTNGSQGLLILAAILFGISIPLTPVQVLWVNMVTAITISFALAFEPLEPGAMNRKPRHKSTPLLSKYFLFRILLVSVIVAGGILISNLYLKNFDLDKSVLNTITLHSLVFALIFHLYNCRHLNKFAINKDFFKNKIAFLVTGLLIILQLLITYVPFLNTILKTAPLTLSQWMIPIGIGVAVFILIEIEKWITRTIFKYEA